MRSSYDDVFRGEVKSAQKIFYAALLICFTVTIFVADTRAQPVKLTVSYTGVGPVNLPVVLAKETGIFARNGLAISYLHNERITAEVRGFHNAPSL